MTDFSLSKINEKIVKDSKFIPKLKESISQVIIGQNELIDKIL
ncbi:MAG: ATPase, partial [Candidatus Marinimicrobia bacterium]|nr:ATPase [Candidatus Neomarinimicrobiota bacterium]